MVRAVPPTYVDEKDRWIGRLDEMHLTLILNRSIHRPDAWTVFHYYVLENRHSLWYVLYSSLVGTVRYGTYTVLKCM